MSSNFDNFDKVVKLTKKIYVVRIMNCCIYPNLCSVARLLGQLRQLVLK